MKKAPVTGQHGSKIHVAGHRGLVGSAIVRRLEADGFKNVLLRTRQELDLTDANRVAEFMQHERPEYVFAAAGKVGGIIANQEFPAEFISENLNIESALISQSFKAGVKRLILLGSSCIYPKLCPQPIKEEYLLAGPLEPTNRPYAVAKVAGIEMCWAFNRQYGTQFLSVMPTNLYGPGDNYHPEYSHVIPGLIQRIHLAKELGADEVVVWGTGDQRREFLTSTDCADACVLLMTLAEEDYSKLINDIDRPPTINIGSGKEITIRDLAELIAKVVGFSGRIVFDSSRPDGTPRKLLDSSRLKKLGWAPKIDLQSGLEHAYIEFLARRASQQLVSL